MIKTTGKTTNTDKAAATGKTKATKSTGGKRIAPSRAAKSPASKLTPRTPKQKKKGTAAVITAVIIIAALFFSVALFAVYVGDLETIYPKITFDNVDVGGMTIAEASDALESAGYGSGEDNVSVALPLSRTLTVEVNKAVSTSQPIEAAAALYAYGRDGNALQNMIAYLRCMVNGYTPLPGTIQEIDSEYVASVVSENVKAVNAELMGSGLEIGDTEIRAVKGAKSVMIDETVIYTLVMSALESGQYGAQSYVPQSTGDDGIDLQSIYNTVYKDAQSAEYDPNLQAASEHVTGVSFDIAAAQSMWDAAKAGDRVIIPLILVEPEITTEYLNSRLFSDVLAEKVTSLATSSSARINNVTVACRAINGVVLNPGDEFSYNTVVGKRTAEAGYQAAGAYMGNEVISELGGGICQVSSTLYYCTLYSNLQINSRSCHSLRVGYLPIGLDAAVSWGGPEYKFTNSRGYPVKIVASVEGTSCKMKILGTDVDGSYVEMTSESWANADGGSGATTYRTVYDKNGNQISTGKEASSRYYPQKVEESPSPSPSESPSPSVEPTTSPEVTPPLEVTPSPSASPDVSPSPEPAPDPEPDVSDEPGDEPGDETGGETEPTA